jgi:hypothetical protein
MNSFFSFIGELLLNILGLIIGIYVFYLIYFKSKTNIPDEDLDKVIKGGVRG